MSKGKQLFDDFLKKLGISLQENNDWDKMTAVWAARERLENYLDPPRDSKGHWLSQQDNLKTVSQDKSSKIAKG